MSRTTDIQAIADSLGSMAARLFQIPSDERTRQGALEMADLLLTVARLQIDPAERPTMPRPGDMTHAAQN